VNAFHTFKSLESNKRTNLLILFCSALFFWISITILFPTLPTYIEDLGGNRQQIGLVMGSFAIGLLSSRTWLGHLTDHKSRKLVVLIGTVVTAIAPLGYLIIKTVTPLMLVRAFHGISIAAFTTAYSALVTDLSPVKQRGELIGYMSLAVPIGMTIGPAIGGFLEAGDGYQTLFMISGTSGLFSLILATQIQESQNFARLLQQPISDNHPQRNFWQILASPAFLVPSLIFFLIGSLFGSLVTFLPLFMREFKLYTHWPVVGTFIFNAGFFYMAASIASFIVRVFIGSYSDRYGRGLFISLSLICYGLSMMVLAMAQNSNSFLLAAILEGTGAGILIPMVLALISDRSHDLERGRVFAICTGGFDVGVALAGPFLGIFSWEYPVIFALSASFAFLALWIFFGYSNQGFSNSFWFALGQNKDHYSL
jgi:MFS family permease